MPLPIHPAPRSLLDRHRQLSPNASVGVSPLCLGAMNFGEANKEKMGECTKETAFEILDHFVSQGGNFIDTANGYQNSESEMWLGEWMASRKNRDEIVLATKSSKGQNSIELRGNETKSLRISLENSLKNLQTSYVDILYLHWSDYTVTIPELMQSLNDLVVAGKVLYLGISDTPAWVVTKSNQYARDHSFRQFVIYQGRWNAGTRDFERDIIPMCRDEGMGLLPYGALGSGRFQSEEGFREREKSHPGRQGLPINEHDRKISQALEKVAKAKGTEITSIAMAYERHKAPYVFPIIGGRKLEHIKGNIAALEISLTESDIKEIEKAEIFDPGFPHTFLGGSLCTGETPEGANGPGDVWLTKLMGNFDWVEPQK